MALGYILGPGGFEILSDKLKEPFLLIVSIAVFIIGMQMGRGFSPVFWKNIPRYSFFYQILEKILFMVFFIIFFLLILPHQSVISIHLAFYLSIASFSFSYFFLRFLKPEKIHLFQPYYKLNHLIIMFFFIVFQFIFPDFHAHFYPFFKKVLMLALFGLLCFLFMKLRIEQKDLFIALAALIFIGTAIAEMSGMSSIIVGFAFGFYTNFISLRKQVVFKKFIFLFNEYIIVLFLFLCGFFMEFSLLYLAIGVIYLFFKILSRFLIHFLEKKDFRGFMENQGVFLMQGEYFLSLILIYAIYYQNYKVIMVAFISLIFAELVSVFYYGRNPKYIAITKQ